MTEKNFVPMTYGKWTTIGPAFHKLCAEKKPKTRLFVLCRCVCGTVKEVNFNDLTRGRSNSCAVCAKVTTGWKLGFHHPDPKIRLMARKRQQIIARCYDVNHKEYHRYGGRDKPIKVCDSWLDPIHGLNNFIKDMGFQPSPELTLDRINNDGDYEPGNCRWATAEQQANNRRNNRKVTWNGVTRNLGQWAKLQGIPSSVLTKRLNRLKWSVEKALTTPTAKQKNQSAEATLVKG